MKCTIDMKLARELSEQHVFYILHRFYPYEDVYKFVLDGQEDMKNISISVGVKDADRSLIHSIALYGLRVDFITIDIAHGHSQSVADMITYIKKLLPKTPVIAGNIGTPEAAIDLGAWGADAVKVGLSMGKSCTTYNCTGVGTPMFTTVLDIAAESPVPVIADGGIREVGDISKALVAGGTMVMVGSEFARCKDSPAKTIKQLEDPMAGIYSYHKEFYGSASSKNKGSTTHIEGGTVLLPMEDKTYFEYLREIEDGVSSTMSYNNSIRIEDLISMKWNYRT
jgi:GMP reductase